MASFSAEPEDVKSFMEKLATDDVFRAELERDPESIMRMSKITISDIPPNFKLPPKELFSKALKDGNVIQDSFVAFLAFFATMR